MKKALFILMLVLSSISCFSQSPVKFLGIPVDGKEGEVNLQLKAKGFKPVMAGGHLCFKGEFAGEDVHVFVASYHGKVWRIYACEQKTRDESQIKIRFNKLVEQYSNNSKYQSLGDSKISDDENLEYGFVIKHKQYSAPFLKNYTEDETNILVKESLAKVTNELKAKGALDSTSKEDLLEQVKNAYNQRHLKDMVWIQIERLSSGEYYIVFFYDNQNNHEVENEL
jgi:hypothetical protein